MQDRIVVGRPFSNADSAAASSMGKLGARSRWGPPRNWHLGDLSNDQRIAVEKLVLAFRAANAEASRAAESAHATETRA